MRQQIKSRGIPFDDVRIGRPKKPNRADFAVKLALKEFEQDGHVNALLDTLRLVARSQEAWHTPRGKLL